ncbi:hypothetical protein [Capsulimonas corticalis]|nr:hypothetical protein [Capsulimonas corticalis]
MKIRRRLADLSPQDLDDYSIWISIMDDYDEDEDEELDTDSRWTLTPYMRPYDPNKPVRMDLVCVVAADFLLADGDKFTGYLKYKGAGMDSIEHVQPAIVSEHGQIDFYSGVFQPSVEQQDAACSVIGKRRAEIFPVTFESRVEIAGHETVGYVDDFYFYEDTKNSGGNVQSVNAPERSGSEAVESEGFIDSIEALGWLEQADNKERTISEDGSTRLSVEYSLNLVRELYAGGAAQVLALGIVVEDDAEEASSLKVILPKDLKSRATLFAIEARALREMDTPFDPAGERGQDSFTLGW